MNDRKQNFLIWLKAGNAKKYSPSFCINNLEEVSRYVMNKNISNIDLFEIHNYRVFKDLFDKILTNKIFRIANRKTYIAFEKTGRLYARFLKEHKDRDINNIPEQIRNEVISIGTETKTIIDAVKIVLKQASPLTIKEICNAILEDNLYIFNAKNPLGVITSEVRGHCIGVELPSRQGTQKHFILIGYRDNGEAEYALNNSDKIDINENRSMTKIWDEEVGNDFRKWLISKGKASATAGQYVSNIKTLVSRYPKEFNDAKLKGTEQQGVKFFIDSLAKNANFLANEAHPSQHNRFTAALRAFYEHISRGSKLDLSVTSPNPISKIQNRANTEKVIDWNEENTFAKTKPRKMNFRDISTSPRAWNYLLVDVCNALIKQFPDKNLEKCDWDGTSKCLIQTKWNGKNSHKKLINGLWLDTNFSADNIVRIIKSFFEYCKIDINELRIVILRSGNSIAYKVTDKQNIKKELTKEQEQILKIFKERFINGMRLNFVDIKILKNTYEEKYMQNLIINDNQICELIKEHGFKAGESQKYIHIDNLLLGINYDKIEDYIEEQFNCGCKRVFIEPLLDLYKDKFSYSLTKEIFIQIIERFSNDKFKINRRSDFVCRINDSLQDRVDDEVSEAVIDVLEKEASPLSKEQIFELLPIYPSSKIEKALINAPKIINNNSLYSHINCVYISEDELKGIKEIIDKEIDRNECISTYILYEKIIENFHDIIENNDCYGKEGIIKAIVYLLKDRYTLTWRGFEAHRKGDR